MATRDPIRRYAEQVAKNKVPAGALHRASCARFLRDVDEQRQRGLKWDLQAGLQVVKFFDHLRQYKGEWAGQPLTLQPWQAFIVANLYGWKRRSDGYRRFRTAFLEMPRGQGKTTLAAGISIWAAFIEGEPSSDVFICATKKDQARLCFDAARHMVLRVPALKNRISVGAYNLHQLSSASKLEPLGADADTLDGLRPHLVVVDEVHAHKDGSVIDVMVTGQGTRRQPLLFEITTAGINRQGPWWAHQEYTRMLLEGRAEDDAWFGFIAGADPEDDWTSEATWKKANPNYAVSVKPDFLKTECRKATAMPIFQSAFRRLHVGQLVEQEEKVIDRRQWDSGIVRGMTLADFRGRVCYGGLDLSSTTDLTAFVLVFPEDGGAYSVLPWFWIPGDNVQKRVDRDRVPYDVWARDGWVRVTPGNITDYDQVRADIVAAVAGLDLRVLAFDPSNATQISTQLQGELGEDKLVAVPQGFKHYHDATTRLIALVAGGSVRHPGHPVLSWNADNLTVVGNSYGEIRPDKTRAVERIDGMVALIMALGQAIGAAEEKPPAYQMFVVGGSR